MIISRLKLVAVSGVLLAFLIVAACGGGGNDSEVGTECSGRFGDPRGPFTENLRKEKITAFEGYNKKGFSLSETVKLKNMGQLETSIRGNLPFPYGVTRQSYNYVIDENCDILVATWKDDTDLEGVLKDVPGDESEAKCPGGRDFTPRNQKGRMINLFPEERKEERRIFELQHERSPCWLDEERTEGLLDAISKHFMLVQGEQSTISTISEFTEDDDRSKTKVVYAGELIVDLGSCTFSLDSNSGTYQPERQYEQAVTMYVAGKLQRESMKISNVAPWCP